MAFFPGLDLFIRVLFFFRGVVKRHSIWSPGWLGPFLFLEHGVDGMDRDGWDGPFRVWVCMPVGCKGCKERSFGMRGFGSQNPLSIPKIRTCEFSCCACGEICVCVCALDGMYLGIQTSGPVHTYTYHVML